MFLEIHTEVDERKWHVSRISFIIPQQRKQERGGKKKYGKILIMGDGYMGVNYTIVYTSIYI